MILQKYLNLEFFFFKSFVVLIFIRNFKIKKVRSKNATIYFKGKRKVYVRKTQIAF